MWLSELLLERDLHRKELVQICHLTLSSRHSSHRQQPRPRILQESLQPSLPGSVRWWRERGHCWLPTVSQQCTSKTVCFLACQETSQCACTYRKARARS